MTESAFHRTTVGPRGRVTISAAVQKEAGISEGDEVVVRVAGNGTVVVETREAIIARVRQGMQPTEPEEPGAVEQLLAWRHGGGLD